MNRGFGDSLCFGTLKDYERSRHEKQKEFEKIEYAYRIYTSNGTSSY